MCDAYWLGITVTPGNNSRIRYEMRSTSSNYTSQSRCIGSVSDTMARINGGDTGSRQITICAVIYAGIGNAQHEYSTFTILLNSTHFKPVSWL